MRRMIIVGLALGCGHPSPPSATKPPELVPERRISMVTSFVVIEACPDAKRMSSVQATKEIEELVGPCTKVPGGAAHFSATLLVDGRVELASPSGDPAEGVVPTCLVQTQKQLRHRLKLGKPCRFDVKLEQR